MTDNLNSYEPDEQDLTDVQIAWLRETSPAKDIPDERFKKIYE
ncbi:hypothetical protein [Serratia sp. Se-RSBMAAmG]|nr:hypothetical protein [Serratia sp. Se-RSBMAAmG]MDI6976068.1 hypothetical protein [Serratia sp. Se-RSBMAAmG]